MTNKIISKIINNNKTFYQVAGAAGTGKSTLIDLLKKSIKSVALAPTGLAACNIQGETIHSFFELNPNDVANNIIKPFSKVKRNLLISLQVIIFDEFSMIRPDLLDIIFDKFKKSNLEYINFKFVFTGDTNQLKSIVNKDEEVEFYKKYGKNSYRSSLFLKDMEFEEFFLTKNYRMSDTEENQQYLKELEIVSKTNQLTPFFDRFFIDRESLDIRQNNIILASTKKVVAEFNEIYFNSLEGKLFISEAIKDNFNIDSIPDTLYLKDGCKVIYKVNDKNFINGSVLEFRIIDDEPYLYFNNMFYKAEKHSFKKLKYKKGIVTERKYDEIFDVHYIDEVEVIETTIVGEFTQYPFTLYKATTIHSAQGQTLEGEVVIVVNDMFDSNMLYTALTRIRNLNQLKLIKL